MECTSSLYRPSEELLDFLKSVDDGKKGEDFYLRIGHTLMWNGLSDVFDLMNADGRSIRVGKLSCMYMAVMCCLHVSCQAGVSVMRLACARSVSE